MGDLVKPANWQSSHECCSNSHHPKMQKGTCALSMVLYRGCALRERGVP